MMAKLHEHIGITTTTTQKKRKREAINPSPKKELTSHVGNRIVNELHFMDEIKL
jgi:hypothetical protein